MRFTLKKYERLKSKKQIEQLYAEGKSIKQYPLRMVFLVLKDEPQTSCKAGFSVAKRNFKKAVDRNRIKRLLRECYRLQKQIVYNNAENSIIYMISYIGKQEPTYDNLYVSMQHLLEKLVDKLKITQDYEGKE